MVAEHVQSFAQAEDSWRKEYDNLTALYQGNVNAMLAASQAAISGYQSLSSELLAFFQSRMKTGLEAAKGITSCTSPDSLVEFQVEYMKAALRAYADELGRLGELSREI